MKYIVRNCPARRMSYAPDGTYRQYCNMLTMECQERTDCVMKQIVELCKEQNLKYDTTACSVLELLEIEEVDEM